MKIIATSGFGPAHDTVEFEIDAGNEQDRNAAAELLDRFYFGPDKERCKCGGECHKSEREELITECVGICAGILKDFTGTLNFWLEKAQELLTVPA